MYEFWLLCAQSSQQKELEQALRIILARTDLEYRICTFPSPDEVKRAAFGKQANEKRLRYAYLLLFQRENEEAFFDAEELWSSIPSLPIIYIAQKADDIFPALSYPFFHIVRSFALEQDMQAAVKKIERLRPSVPEELSFSGGMKLLKLLRKDILYLDSDRHEIRIHTRDETICITETLSQCEKRLRAAGFVRIHKSFLVNMFHISRLETDSVVLSNQERLYVSRYRFPEVKLQFEAYIRRLEFM